MTLAEGPVTTIPASYLTYVDPRILAATSSLVVPLRGAAAVDVDDQNDFGSKGGSLYVPGAEETRERSFEFFRRFHWDNRFTTGCDHPADDCSFVGFGGTWPPHCVRDTWGAELVPGLPAIRTARHVKKGWTGKVASYGAVHDDNGNSNGLAEALHDRSLRRVFVFRLAFDFCVGETAIQLAEAGFEVYLVVDLTHSINITLSSDLYKGLNSVEVMLERLKAAGVSLVFSTNVLV